MHDVAQGKKHSAVPLKKGGRPSAVPEFGVGEAGSFTDAPVFRKAGCACGGGCPSCKSAGGLNISKPSDPAEIEADQIADRVMRMPDQGRNPHGSKGVADESGLTSTRSLPFPVLTGSAPAHAGATDSVADRSNTGPYPYGSKGTSNTIHRKCDACEDEDAGEQVMRKESSASAAASSAPPPPPGSNSGNPNSGSAQIDSVISSGGRPLDNQTRSFFEPRFNADLSHVRIFTDSSAGQSARAINAKAYTLGSNIVFGQGEYKPDSDSGKQLIAHELAHVGQSGKAGREFARQIRRRRLPPGAGLSDAVPTADPTGFSRARIGLARAASRAWGGLTAAQQARVRTGVSGFLTWTTEDDLRTRLESASRTQLMDFAQAIRTVAPRAELGDPLLIDVGARPGTADAANITRLVNAADSIFTTIASGARDAHLTQVFGSANVAAAKTKYANAQTQMHTLHAADKIVTDRSGYSEEVSLGGLSDSGQISVDVSTMDHPTRRNSIVTMIHESMHAGNADVDDKGYIHQPSFTVLPEADKITNAAHFEVVPRRMLGMGRSGFAFPGVTFVPAGTGGTPILTPRQQAIRDASEAFRSAWDSALNLHTLFVRLFRSPTEWDTLDLSFHFTGAAAGSHFSQALPFWSLVEMLTIHTRRPSINPAGTPDVRPVTLIDIALSEGLTRKLSQGMDFVPQTEAAAGRFEGTHASAAEITAASASSAAERDLLIRLVLRVHLGSLTGATSRDESVVARLAAAAAAPDFSDLLGVRPPSGFP